MPLPVAPSHDRHGGRADDPGVFPGEVDQEDPAPPRAWGAAPEPRDPRVYKSALPPAPRAAHAPRVLERKKQVAGGAGGVPHEYMLAMSCWLATSC